MKNLDCQKKKFKLVLKNKLYFLFLLLSIFLLPKGILAQTATPPTVGDGSSGNPYQIATLENLYWITQSSVRWQYDYIQTADINASSSSGWDGGSGFTPIGNSSSEFTGTYNGQGYSISNLYINRPTYNYIGFFGYTTGATISNINIVDANITGDYRVGVLVGSNVTTNIEECNTSGSVTAGQDYIGGLTGSNTGTITNCSSTATVSGDQKVGGFSGSNTGSVTDCYSKGNVTATYTDAGGFIGSNGGAITNCYSTGDVSSSAGQVGSFVGYNYSTIQTSYSTGNAAGTYSTGGFVGQNTDNISNCYSLGNASGTNNVGGFVGYHVSNNIYFISFCYSIGDPDGDTYQGGFAGRTDNSATFNTCFWNTTTSNTSVSAGGRGRPYYYMNNSAYYTNQNNLDAGESPWDFQGTPNDDTGTNDYWDIHLTCTGNSYPILEWQISAPKGSGIEADPYIISTPGDLCWLSNSDNRTDWDKYYIQTADIDFANAETWETFNGPIGGGIYSDFSGTYDGQGHTITGLTLDESSSDEISMFGCVWGGAILNLGLIDVNIAGKNYVGGLVGKLYANGSVSNCFVTGTVNGELRTGGITGYAYSSAVISDCYANVTTNGTDYVGGLVGQNTGTAGNSYCLSAVLGTGTNVGALAGINTGTITESFWNNETSVVTTSAGGTEKTDAEMKNICTYTTAGWDIPNTWRMNSIENNSYPFLEWQGYSHTEACCPSPTEAASSIVFGTVTTSSIILSSYTAPTNGADGYAVYVNSTNSFSAPADGTSPSANPIWANNGQQCIYFGTSVTPNATTTELTEGVYYFKVYAYNDCNGTEIYETTGVTINETTGCGAPNGAASNIIFGAIADNSIILSEYTAPVNGADGYVAYINNVNSWVAPNNGDNPTANTAWQNSGQQCIYFGTSTSPNTDVTALAKAVTYYFKVYSYNDCSGTNTYETTGTGANAVPGFVSEEPTVGNGSSGSPYQIASLSNLYWITQDVTRWDKYYIQTANIDATSTNTWDVGDHDNDAGTADKAMGFTSIGNISTKFTGEYNGNGHIIDGLYINRPTTDYIGLFGHTYDSTIDSLGVKNVDITGKDYTGGLVGDNYHAIITNSFSTGNVSGNSHVGGFVGYFRSGVSTIDNSYSTANVNSSGSYTGGLVGYNYYSTVISNSYSTGKVTSSGSYTGGLVGRAIGSTINSFWDIETSGLTTSVGGTGKTTAEMQDITTFTDLTTNGLTETWDYIANINDDTEVNDYWAIGSGNNGYLLLSWQDSVYSYVVTNNMSDVTGTTATGNGEITFLSISNPIARGFCWNTAGNPTVDNDNTDEGATSNTGTFASSITGLTQGVTYYAKAYVTNDYGTNYGEELEFIAGGSYATTDSVINITNNTATGYGNITTLGLSDATAHGFCWNTTGNPTTSDSYTDEGVTSTTGTFSTNITGLQSGLEYYAKAYVTNSVGTVYGNEISFIVAPKPAGLGTIADQYQIATLGNLRWLMQSSNEWDKYYVQTADINAANTSTWYNGIGFSPIGSTLIAYFTGSYNGKGHTISNLYINRPSESSIGLFGTLDAANIDSLGVINVDITADQTSASLAGRCLSSTTITNCFSTGNVNGSYRTGGLVGYNSNSIIDSCFSSVNVTCSGNYNGGLVGENRSDAIINRSYSTGNIDGPRNEFYVENK